jgi:hypothetical protein
MRLNASASPLLSFDQPDTLVASGGVASDHAAAWAAEPLWSGHPRLSARATVGRLLG